MKNATRRSARTALVASDSPRFYDLACRFPFGSDERYARFIVWQMTGSEHEVPEVAIGARFEAAGIAAQVGEEAIDELVGERIVESTVIDARAKCGLDRNFGVLPALRRVVRS